MTTTTLPADSYVLAALDELITDTQSLLDAALLAKPRDADAKDEIAYWKRQRNSFVNALADWTDGLRPTPALGGYLFPSSSRPGSLRHRVWRQGGVWACSCEAGEKGFFHRHTATVAALLRAAELAARDAQQDEEPRAPDPDAARIAAEVLLAARLAETARWLADERARQQLAARICAARGSSQWAA